jgi:hypothetical protein
VRLNVTSFFAVVSFATLTALHPPASALAAPRGPKPDAAKLAEAKRHMSAGAAFYNDPSGHKCEEAIREFSKAYELSGSLNALKGMAVCNLELERDGEAIEQYTKFLEGKGKQLDATEKQQIETDLSTLKAAVVYITFTTDNGHVDFQLTDIRTPSRGYPVTNRYELPQTGQTLGIHPGLHTFTATAEGKPDQVWKIEITNGSKYEHTFEFDKPVVTEAPKKEPPDQQDQPVTRPVPAAVYAVGGFSLAALGTTVGLMVWAKGKNTDYAAKNGHAPAAELKGLQAGVKTANLIADIGLGVTVVSVVTTTALYFTRPTKRAEPKASSWVVAPILGPAGGGAVLTGSF